MQQGCILVECVPPVSMAISTGGRLVSGGCPGGVSRKGVSGVSVSGGRGVCQGGVHPYGPRGRHPLDSEADSPRARGRHPLPLPCEHNDSQTGIKTLPCPKLRLVAVINQKLFCGVGTYDLHCSSHHTQQSPVVARPLKALNSLFTMFDWFLIS